MQLSFRAGRGAADAFVAPRRLVESALSAKNGKWILLALGGWNAFDSVDLDHLVLALSHSWFMQMTPCIALSDARAER